MKTASRRNILFLVLGLLPSILVAALALFSVPGAIAIYEPVADSLPSQTRFVFSFYYLCAVLPILVLLVWYRWHSQPKGGPAAATLGLLGSAALMIFGWWAVYQPDLILELIRRSGEP